MPADSQYYHAEHADAPEQPALLPAPRDADGRWRKGASGNPTGRPKGSRNQATRMAEALLDAASAMLTKKAIELAMDGDGIALRFCLARILAPRRFAPVELDLPPLDTHRDLSLALAAIGQATAAGEVTSEQAVHFARVLDAAGRAITARDAEYYENRFRRRERSPAAPPLPRPSEDAERDPA